MHLKLSFCTISSSLKNKTLKHVVVVVVSKTFVCHIQAPSPALWDDLNKFRGIEKTNFQIIWSN